ncbi:unnamed protein product [Parnassius apollo]|uniref:(apollo) hypothetical protein n=1 Tax=Parnassius apollo TaxID=110799 RepID=A0A8S3WZW0_PARAO|nr:unnamed protein product [Parnassius apollo]
MMHLNTECSGLTTKQRNALRASENLDWSCSECKNTSSRRTSIVIPEDDDDEAFGSPITLASVPLDGKKLLLEISLKVECAIQRQLSQFAESLEFNARKLDDILETVDAFKTTVKKIKKNIELSNQNKNLEYRISALEQRLQEQEQQQLIKTIDIFNIPFTDNEDLLNVVQKIQQKLELEENIIEVKCFGYNRNNSGKLRVVLPSETVKTK